MRKAKVQTHSKMSFFLYEADKGYCFEYLPDY